MYVMADNDFLTQLLANIQSQVVRVDQKQDAQISKLDRIEIQTTKHNSRLTMVENKAKRLDSKIKKMEHQEVLPSEVPNVWQDKKLLGVATTVILMIVTIIYMLVSALTDVEWPL